MKTSTAITLLHTEGEAYLNFTCSIRSRATLKHFLFLIQRYAAFRKSYNLDQLIADDSQNLRMAAAHIKQFLFSLHGLSKGSIANYRNALKHFYEMNDVALNWKKISKFARMEREEEEGGPPKRKDRAYSHEEIQKMLEKSNEKTRAIILLLASTGVRVGAIPPLCLSHLTKIENFGLYQITVYPGSGEEYVTFCTPEAAKAIDSYLSHREHCGERLNENSPVFRKDFDTSDPFKVRNNIKHLSIAGVSFLIRQALDKAGLLPFSAAASVRHEVARNHGFRKFVNTMMIQSDMKGAAKETLLGHSTGMDDKYYRPSAGQLLEEYLKAVDLLTINEENRLRRKVEQLTIKRDKMEKLENEIEELKRLIKK